MGMVYSGSVCATLVNLLSERLGYKYMRNYKLSRDEMVLTQLSRRGITDERVLDVMRQVKRHEFVEEAFQNRAYEDTPLPIDNGQTISQPFIVARMTELLSVQPTDKVLEIGTG